MRSAGAEMTVLTLIWRGAGLLMAGPFGWVLGALLPPMTQHSEPIDSWSTNFSKRFWRGFSPGMVTGRDHADRSSSVMIDRRSGTDHCHRCVYRKLIKRQGDCLMRHRVKQAIIIGLAFMALSGCASDPAPPTLPASSTSPTITEASLGIEDGFSRTPLAAIGAADDKQASTISWLNLERASELAGLKRPSDEAGQAKWLVELLAKNNDPSSGLALALPRLIRDPRPERYDAVAKEVGFQPAAVSTSLEIDRPPVRYAVLTGSFDDKQMTAAMGEPSGGVWSIGPDQDFQSNLQQRSDLRRIGEGLRFARSGEALLSSTDSNLVKQGQQLPAPGKSLNDSPALQVIAQQLDAAKTYSALITNVVPTGFAGSLRQTPDEAREAQASSTTLQPFVAIGIGLTSTMTAVFVFVHVSPDSAAKNKDALESALRNGTEEASNKPLSEFFAVKSVTQTDTAITVEVSFAPNRARVPFDMLMRQIAPFRNGPIPSTATK